MVRFARQQGADVLAVVRDASKPHERWHHDVPSGAGTLTVATMEAMLNSPQMMASTDLVIHAAAIRHRHGAGHAAYQASNVDVVTALVNAAAGRVGRLVFVSSVGVYGFPQDLPVDERTPFAPCTLYSRTKVQAEHAVEHLAPAQGVPYTIVRPTIVYGPGDSNGMLDKLAAMLRARRYLVVGDGRNPLHHTYIDDVVRGLWVLGTTRASCNDHFILAGPETITLQRLSELVARAVDAKLWPVRVPLRVARMAATGIDALAARGLAFTQREPPVNHEKLDVMTRPIAFDATKAKAAGFTATVGYEEGIARTFGEQAAMSRLPLPSQSRAAAES